LKKFVVTANAPIMEERTFIEGEQYYAMAMAMTIQCNAMQCNTELQWNCRIIQSLKTHQKQEN